MRTAKMAPTLGISALLLCALAAPSTAQERAKQRAPIIRVYSDNGVDVIGTTTYVTPAIQVSDNAYVFAVSMDLDGNIQVLHPDFPGLSVQIAAHKQLRLPNFFAGFAQQDQYGGIYSRVGGSRYYRNGSLDSRGTVIALASRAPFNLELIESGGNWDISAIRPLIENRSPQDAAQALASYLGAKGEPIGRDYMRFAGGRTYDFAYGGYGYDYYGYDPCTAYYGYGFGPLRQVQFYRYLSSLPARGQQVRILGYDVCGFPILAPLTSPVTGHFPAPRPPHNPGDTTVFPKSRIPMGGIPRHPSEPNTAPQNTGTEGFFAPRQRPDVPQMGDDLNTAPTGRRPEPRQTFDEPRGRPGTISEPQRQVPIERPIPRNEPTTATGSQPPREYRPSPRVESPAPPREYTPPPRVEAPPPQREYRPPPRVESPPPERVPDRPRESPPPAPVVRERPASPPPRSEPVPPPRRQ
jgi:hypothetical protein